MPPIETFRRNQYAVYWPPVGIDQYGQVIVGAPIELQVRWEYGRKQVISPENTLMDVDALVTVDRRLEINGNIWHGRLSELGTGTADFDIKDNELLRIVFYDEVPNIKKDIYRREVGVRYINKKLNQ